MFKLLSLAARLIALAGVLVSVQSVAKHVTQQQKALGSLTAAAAQGKSGLSLFSGDAGPLVGTAGDGLDLQGFNVATALPKLMSLMTQDPASPSQAHVAPQSMTVIRYNGPKKSGEKSKDTSVSQLPPGANAAVVDGRWQIYYASGKPKGKAAEGKP
jgi:hypothetical protein